MENNWYAVYTKCRWEKKVSDELIKIGLESYCPLNKVVRQWSDRKKYVEVPLFTSYVFVNISPKEQTKVRQTRGVVNFVSWLGCPARIKAEEIAAIKDFLASHHDVRLERTQINMQNKVKVINGPFIEMEGNVIGIKSKTVRIVISSLGFSLTAELAREDIVLTA